VSAQEAASTTNPEGREKTGTTAQPEPSTDAQVKSALASLATNEIAAFDARVEKILRSVDRDWPDAMCNNEVPLSLAFLLFSALEVLQEKAKESGELAREASEYDEELKPRCGRRSGR
jgi:hypothetical protein